MNKLATLALGIGLIATTAQADIVSYDCDLHNLERGWISEKIYFSVDPENKCARVYDAYTHTIDGKPKDVVFKTTRKGDYRMNWKMRIPMSRGGTAYVSYTATLNPKTRKLNLIARFPQVNASNRPKGVGSCAITQRQSLFGS